MYATSLRRLGSGPSGGSAFVSPDLGAAATATKSGYQGPWTAPRRRHDGSLQRRGSIQPLDRVSRLGGPGVDLDRHALLRHQHDRHDLAGTATLSGMTDSAVPSGGTAIQ